MSPGPADPWESKENKDSLVFLDCRASQVWLPLVHRAPRDHLAHLDPKENQESRCPSSPGPQERLESPGVAELKENLENQEYQISCREMLVFLELKV